MKKIALVTCGSNFERHGNTIRAMRRKIAEMKGVSFALENLVPAAPQDGDVYIILPIHYISRSYGYMVFQNEMLPVDNYHYRICQDSIGSSIDNLHRHLIQKSTIAELDLLHMQDQLTGLILNPI